jgi:Killing trait
LIGREQLVTQDGSVNSQITDSVSQTVALLTGQAPAQAMGMLDAVLVETLGMAMHNAVMRQQNGQMVTSAALTAACAKMLQTPIGLPAAPAPPPPPPAPPPAPPAPSSNSSSVPLSTLAPLTNSGGPSEPNAVMAKANAEAQQALQTLVGVKNVATTTAEMAQLNLNELANMVNASTQSPQGSEKTAQGDKPGEVKLDNAGSQLNGGISGEMRDPGKVKAGD